ncbi:1-deoxy-D-xylulose-5-phosphate synthase [Buchnera aphidicola (Mindarus keteleerifoliae)]|uniref:1-deoxy-D-xylulose-5-phosphate synthase n=1 Tax=Buchnera aphidicola TaxID=9 RepID=UPI0031B6CBE8
MNYFVKNYPTLFSVNSVQKLRLLSIKKLPILCTELRSYLINNINEIGGHFSSNLGTIELTIAIHYMYNTPFDNLLWDVGHQSYSHKILTGRFKDIFTIGKKNGLHPFPSCKESKYDSFGTGHSSTTISAGLGMAVAAHKEKKNRKTISIIGDAAIAGGMSLEAINHAASVSSDFLIILNDNNMSISNSIGMLKNFFSILTNKNKSCLFKKKDFYKIICKCGIKYYGPHNGHNIISLVNFLKKLKLVKGIKLLHITTKKGNGYFPAERNPTKWHFVHLNNKRNKTFSFLIKKKITYSKIFGNWLCKIAKKDKKVLVITPAMSVGSGIEKFSKLFPKQYFDVGIAEQHAVTFAAGLASKKYKPIVAIYSTFLQRAYDQIIHDVSIQNLPILFVIDRAGIVGHDGKTHQGMFDLTYLRCIPNFIVMAPSNGNEFIKMLNTGYLHFNKPIAIRYPKKEFKNDIIYSSETIKIGKALIKRIGKKAAILNFGSLFSSVEKVSKRLNFTLVDMRFIKPLDISLILLLAKNYNFLITVEEGIVSGGAGSSVNELLMLNKINVSVLNIGLPDKFVSHGSQNEIKKKIKLDSKGIQERIETWLN